MVKIEPSFTRVPSRRPVGKILDGEFAIHLRQVGLDTRLTGKDLIIAKDVGWQDIQLLTGRKRRQSYNKYSK